MKKNAMLKIAAILMVAVLLTTCAISSTFAKYTTADSDSTSARVAKWGVIIDSEFFADTDSATNDLFFKDYAREADTGFAHVKSNDQVVAPGTSASIDVDNFATGTPEVSGKVIVAADFTLENWEDEDGNFYCPLSITINGVTKSGLNYESAADFKEAFGQALTETLYFDAGKAVNEGIDFNIAWEWAFFTSVDNDAKDTWLANAGIEGTPSAENEPATIAVTLTVTIEQFDGVDTEAQNG